MNQDPRCRDDFIEAMEADDTGKEYNLTWYPLLSDAKGNCDDPTSWEWDDGMTEEVYRRGWCLLWQPPRDVDPESVLGILVAIRDDAVCGGIVANPMMRGSDIYAADIINLIESQQRQIEGLEAEQ